MIMKHQAGEDSGRVQRSSGEFHSVDFKRG